MSSGSSIFASAVSKLLRIPFSVFFISQIVSSIDVWFEPLRSSLYLTFEQTEYSYNSCFNVSGNSSICASSGLVLIDLLSLHYGLYFSAILPAWSFLLEWQTLWISTGWVLDVLGRGGAGGGLGDTPLTWGGSWARDQTCAPAVTAPDP